LSKRRNAGRTEMPAARMRRRLRMRPRLRMRSRFRRYRLVVV
jgi:hypothetical protein